MKNMKCDLLLKLSLASLLALISFESVFAQEEAFDLNDIPATTSAPAPTANPAFQAEKLKIMGRVDLTMDRGVDTQSELKNNHFLLFLKTKVSPKVSFMGEFVTQAFFNVDYTFKEKGTLQFGKILVPFGDSRYFHRYYGGLQGYGAQGVMFPNIWAEPGVNANWHSGDWTFDFYWVNAVAAPDVTSDVDFQQSTTERQALGTRVQKQLVDNLDLIFSFYSAEYLSGRPLYLGGLDMSSGYGAFGLKHFRFAVGVANAWVTESPTGDDFQKYGDYVQIATNAISSVDLRLRYGTYDEDDRMETVEDTQSLNLGASFMLDVLRVLFEHQLNYEAVNETDNDLTRIMVSLDF